MPLSHNPWDKGTPRTCAPIFPPNQSDTKGGPDDLIRLRTAVHWECTQSAAVVQEKLLLA